MIQILFIAVICVIITDYLQFFENLKPLLSKIFGFPVRIGKPFSCSTCQTFWLGLIFLCIKGTLCLQNIMWLLLIACCCPLILNIIYNVRDILGILINLPITFLNLDKN